MNQFPKSGKKKLILLALAIGILSLALQLGCARQNRPQSQKNLLNFQHLDHLYETIRFRRRPVGVIHIYSEAPDYHWVNAPGEGIACVDDIARAAVVYLRQYRATGDESYFQKARLLLRFVLAMQAPNGLFYNFILPDHQINTTRPNSRNRLDFWTARAVWALGEGSRITRQNHPEFSDTLKQALRRTLPALRKLIQNYPKTETIAGRKYPTWLINRYAADATSELLLGLEAFEQVTEDSVVCDLIQKFSDGLVLMQQGDWLRAPFGAHLSFLKIWHGWGNAQSQALVKAGQLCGRPDFLESARKEADWFFSRLLINGWKSSLLLNDSLAFRTFPQIAYEVRTVALGLENLYQATAEKKYAILACLAASWLFGNNPAGKAMYDPSTGRCFDGIESPIKINRNAGAESTIEALLTLQAVQHDSIARKYLFYLKRSKTQSIAKNGKIVYIYRRYSDGKKSVVVYLNLQNGQMNVVDGQAWNKNIFGKNSKNGGMR